MSNGKKNMDDRPIWLTSLADADRGSTPDDALENRLQTALRRRHHTNVAKRVGAVGLAAALAVALWLPTRNRPSAGIAGETVDESVMDAISEAMSQSGDDEADFVPTELASEQPLESIRVVRVSLPAGALSSYGAAAAKGAPVSGDVTADLLVGQDGIARAVRVVK